MNYVEQMQILINKTIIDIAVIYALVIIVIGVVWIAPFCYYRKKSEKQKNASILKKSLIIQASITFICLLFSLITISSFQDINNMKKDIKNNSFVTYVGNYDIDNTYRFSFSASELWFDLRAVTVEGEEEPLWFDMTSNIGIDIHDAGTIVYGKNSRYIVKLEYRKVASCFAGADANDFFYL